ncbi:MAG: hypothetical protein ACK4SR_10895 [Thiobacillus sp.]
MVGLLKPCLARCICLLTLGWTMLAYLPWPASQVPMMAATLVAVDATPEVPDLPAIPRTGASPAIFPKQIEVRVCVATPQPAEFPGHAAARAPPYPAV